ncbi:hypothetical protein SMKI_14G3780 [Saccharomyces mikatae IFO 1815]|uniref:MARVEL domain-containing protein n=1 Tax=Saccharomyces mikatae IFO 1815 TaxID=226126 RepID=A0AA35IUU1_SACMI|nr:uncharacterized protein SMKI_14G3780 [Saccharomyces mikatae IFO 1815]CAI4036159.1 hypothetical protein SMKI_14G3780 [Saccharomyces mikatae IFO 1815]
MSKSIKVSSISSLASWATKPSPMLRYFQICLSVANLILALFAANTCYSVDPILRLSVAVSIISLVYLVVMNFLHVLLNFGMEISLTILWFASFVTLVSDFGFTSCSSMPGSINYYYPGPCNPASPSCPNMPRGINFDYSGSCKIAKIVIFIEAIIFILSLASTYVSYSMVLSQCREHGSSTRSIFKAGVKALRNIVQRLEASLEESESLLDLEAGQNEKDETEAIENSVASEDNSHIGSENATNNTIEASEC